MHSNPVRISQQIARALAGAMIIAAVVVGALAPRAGDVAAAGPCFGLPANFEVTSTSGGFVSGTSGDDVIMGGPGNDTLYGNGGNDRICGGAGNDTIRGNGGNDRLDGGVDNDWIAGDSGYDIIKGGGGLDTLRGGTEDDTLSGNAGDDDLFGDSGADTVDFSESLAGVSVSLEVKLDNVLVAVSFREGRDDLVSIENVTGSPFNDSIGGSSGPNRILGGGGNDTISGSGRAPGRPRPSGIDYLHGGIGTDTITCTDNSCLAYGSSDGDTINLNTPLSEGYGGDGDDRITVNTVSRVLADGGRNVDTITCETACTARGGDGSDTLLGGGQDDELFGGAGEDRIEGRGADDVMFGDSENDYLDGGAGIDSADGGAGEYDWCFAEGALNCENRYQFAPVAPLPPPPGVGG